MGAALGATLGIGGTAASASVPANCPSAYGCLYDGTGGSGTHANFLNSSPNITTSPLAVSVESVANHTSHNYCFYVYSDINYGGLGLPVSPNTTIDLVNFNNGAHPPTFEPQYHHTYSVRFKSC